MHPKRIVVTPAILAVITALASVGGAFRVT
jgi:hypothetical protein